MVESIQSIFHSDGTINCVRAKFAWSRYIISSIIMLIITTIIFVIGFIIFTIVYEKEIPKFMTSKFRSQVTTFFEETTFGAKVDKFLNIPEHAESLTYHRSKDRTFKDGKKTITIKRPKLNKVEVLLEERTAVIYYGFVLICCILLNISVIIRNIICLRKCYVYYDKTGVWFYNHGFFPWATGSLGMRWDSLNKTGYEPTAISWLFNSYTIVLESKYGIDKNIAINSIWNGNKYVEILNNEIENYHMYKHIESMDPNK